MNDNQECSPIAALFAAASMMGKIESLEKKLESANRYIEYLQDELKKKVAKDIAESCFGYKEPRPAVHRWNEDLFPSPNKIEFNKANTVVMTSASLVCRELIELHSQRPELLEDRVKDHIISDLFCKMQERGMFKFYQKKLKFETLFTAAIEVAK